MPSLYLPNRFRRSFPLIHRLRKPPLPGVLLELAPQNMGQNLQRDQEYQYQNHNPWNVFEDWINKIADGWTVQQDPNDSQTVDVIPSAAAAKAGAQAYKWEALVMVSRPPVEECGVATAPGKPVKACP